MATGLGFGGNGWEANGNRARGKAANGKRDWASQTGALPELLFLCRPKTGTCSNCCQGRACALQCTVKT